jgi:hypothetical protein
MSFVIIKDFFKQIAVANKEIDAGNKKGTYFGSIKQAADRINDMRFPCLVLNSISGVILNTHENKQDQKRIEFMVLYSAPIQNNEKINEAKDNAFATGMDIVSKLENDQVMMIGEEAYYFKTDSVSYKENDGIFDHAIGIVFTLDIIFSSPIQYNAEKWQ